MCGLAGFLGGEWQGGADETIQIVSGMSGALVHRGPDDAGSWYGGPVAFGHRRLSIIDLSARSHQPMIDEELSLVFNGAIYNYRELRAELQARGHHFASGGDTEVILKAYREWGEACPARLHGMFAFAIFDGPDVMLARDPIGIKPLYYAYDRERIYFTSELGAMTLAGVEEVHEFPAGHYYTSRDGFVRYYRVPAVQDDPIADVERAAGLIRRRFIKAVKDRLLSDPDVPVGSFCSGGLDSSLVATIAAENIPRLHTFAVGMRDANGELSDDLKAGRIAADYIGATHHELVFSEDDYYEALPLVIRKLETYDPALVRCAVPCYFTCQLAADYVTVVLTGEGADELFAGYHYMKHFAPETALPGALFAFWCILTAAGASSWLRRRDTEPVPGI